MSHFTIQWEVEQPHDVRVRYANSIRKVKGVFRPIVGRPDWASYFLGRLVPECEMARKLTGRDPFADRREEDRRFLNRWSAARAAALTLAKFCEANPHPAGLALALAILQSEIRIVSTCSEQIAYADAFATFFETFGRLDDSALPARKGPWAHRFVVGPLMFPSAVDDRGALPSYQTALAVCLSHLFRRYTANKLGHFDRSGEGRFDDGKPHWAIVAQLVTDAFEPKGDYDEHRCRKAVEMTLKRHPGLEVWGYRNNHPA